ncbi:MAG: DNA mismatch repair endonuclease MutL [Verrucomicrobiae bacterium]|nr:DNA mismatch repair endonuclease MutL [Verrucomicrobiae bacterium]
MGKIRLLSDALASQVAAGEVVERPASVVKELVENSLDAGASTIEIAVQRGGIALIRVVDDGSGMNRDDALMCVERHATSKIRTKDDLAAIGTLGFRGEALPSIASVSKFRLATREPGALTGTEVLINGGKMAAVKDCGEPPGTQIEVRSLFFNIPARRKFLRTENTEFSHLEQTVRVQALAHPEVRFALVRNDRLVFQLPATKDGRDRIRGLAGADLAGRLLEVPKQTHHGVTVSGFIGPPGMGRSDRKQMLTFLNGRPVEAAMLTYALREGYHTALMKGQYPVTFLFLETDPGAVDVNVHPAKREVRFHDGNSVRDAVITAVSDTLTRQMRRPVSGVGLTGAEKPMPVPVPARAEQHELIPESEQRSLRKDWSDLASVPRPSLPGIEVGSSSSSVSEERGLSPRPDPVESPETTEKAPVEEIEERAEPDIETAPKAEDFRLLGVLGKLYVLLEGKEGLVLMDQHAAHERVLFEEMRRRMETEGVPTQALLVPLTVELAPRDFDLVSQNLETLAKLGVSAEPFGGNTLKIDALPTFLKSDDPERFIHQVIDELRGASRQTSKMRLGEDMVATTVCRHAVKANDPLHSAELDKLLRDLLVCEMPYCCPHGRPTLIQISYAELERKFGRRT